MYAYAAAVVPQVQDLEGNGRLRTLARLEGCAGVEDCRAELQGIRSASRYMAFAFSYARNRGALACLLAMQRCRQARDNLWIG